MNMNYKPVQSETQSPRFKVPKWMYDRYIVAVRWMMVWNISRRDRVLRRDGDGGDEGDVGWEVKVRELMGGRAFS